MTDTMEKLMFFCAFSYRIIQITSSDAADHDPSILRVQPNENIRLNCSMTDKYEISWYHQNLNSGQLTLLMAAKTSSVAGRKLLVRYNQNWSRLKVNADVEINTVTLDISGITESDSGLYFCGTKSVTSEMHFNKPIRLLIAG
ncbi:T cell receptor alpha variable 17 [Labeo rohita]|nr:T cell receptor alpha variable 17 [Labeo rohita]